jgi:hypothetical protein
VGFELKKKSTGFNKLTPFEKEALLYAMLQQYEPSEAIHTIIKNYDSLDIRWDGYRRDIVPSLRTILKKLDTKTADAWISVQTNFEDIGDIFTELELLAKNDEISFRAKGIGAFLILEMYMDNDLRRDPEVQKKLVHEYSKLNGDSIYDLYGELKSTVTKALMELGKHPKKGKYFSEYHEKWKHEMILRENLDVAEANHLLDTLRDDDLSWQAKGVFLYLFIFGPLSPSLINVFNPNSSIEKGMAELSDKRLIGANAG